MPWPGRATALPFQRKQSQCTDLRHRHLQQTDCPLIYADRASTKAEIRSFDKRFDCTRDSGILLFQTAEAVSCIEFRILRGHVLLEHGNTLSHRHILGRVPGGGEGSSNVANRCILRKPKTGYGCDKGGDEEFTHKPINDRNHQGYPNVCSWPGSAGGFNVSVRWRWKDMHCSSLLGVYFCLLLNQKVDLFKH